MTRSSRGAARLLVPFLVAALGGCADHRLRREADATIRAYNQALVLAYRTSSAGPLRDVAGKDELRRVGVLIELKASNKLVLESELQKFELVGVRQDGSDTLTARTKETWRYQDRSLRPGSPPGTLFVAAMEMEWALARRGGRWKVEKGRTLKSEYLEPKGFQLEPPNRHAPEPGGAGKPIERARS